LKTNTNCLSPRQNDSASRVIAIKATCDGSFLLYRRHEKMNMHRRFMIISNSPILHIYTHTLDYKQNRQQSSIHVLT